MGFTGKVNVIDDSVGGFVHNINSDNLPPSSMVEGSRNINLQNGGKEKRGGTEHLFSTALGGGSFYDSAAFGTGVWSGASTLPAQITGLFNFAKTNGSSTIISTNVEGSVYSDNLNLIATGVGSQFPTFETLNDMLLLTNITGEVKTWDGTAASMSVLANQPLDWAGVSPRQIIKHGKNNSERLWAIGVPGFESNIYISALGSTDFGTTPFVLHIETGDQGGIIGGVEFGDRIILFSRNSAYTITDTDLDTNNWGYEQSQWTGGVAGNRVIVRVPNDVLCFTADGDIYSVVSADNYGDYKEASLIRGSFLHKWIEDFVDLAQIDKFHGVYDRNLRAVKFFIVRKGSQEVDTALVFYIDSLKNPENGWTIHDNVANPSGYSASCSAWAKNNQTDRYFVITGDYLSTTWRLEQDFKADNKLGFLALRKTPPLDFGNSRMTKGFRKGHIIAREEGNFNVTIKVFIDGDLRATETVTLGGSGSVYGSAFFSTGTYGEPETLIERDFQARFIGRRIQYEISNAGPGEDMFISKILTDYQELGVRPTWTI